MEMVKVWAHPRSLATTNGLVVYFLFLWVIRCFSSPAYRLSALYIQAVATRHNSHEVSPFGHPRFKACEAAPRGLSQPATSFVGVLCQGILYVRLSNFLRIMRHLASRVSHRAGSRNKSADSGCSSRGKSRESHYIVHLPRGICRKATIPWGLTSY